MDNILLPGLKYDTPLAMMTLGQLMEAFEVTKKSQEPKNLHAEEFIYGLRGIQKLFGISHKTAQAWKNTWLAPACDQVGRTIIVDKEEALRLFKERGRKQND